MSLCRGYHGRELLPLGSGWKRDPWFSTGVLYCASGFVRVSVESAWRSPFGEMECARNAYTCSTEYKVKIFYVAEMQTFVRSPCSAAEQADRSLNLMGHVSSYSMQLDTRILCGLEPLFHEAKAGPSMKPAQGSIWSEMRHN